MKLKIEKNVCAEITMLDAVKKMISDDVEGLWLEPTVGENITWQNRTALNKQDLLFWGDKGALIAHADTIKDKGLNYTEAKIFLRIGVIHFIISDGVITSCKVIESEEGPCEFLRREEDVYLKNRKKPSKLIKYDDVKTGKTLFWRLHNDN